MNTLLKIIIGLVIVLGLLVIVGFLLPSEYHVERDTVVAAPVEAVFEEVNDLENWQHWSPWAEKDPEMDIQYHGPEKGSGSKMVWNSEHEEVGSGALTITESEDNEYIKTNIEFTDWESSSQGSWKFEEQGDGTKVSWGVNGELGSNPIARYMGLFMEGMISPDFEKGLSNLKKFAEQKPRTTMNEDITISQSGPLMYIGIKEEMPAPDQIGPRMGELYGELQQFMQKNNIDMAGMPLTVYYGLNGDLVEMEPGLPVSKKVEAAGERIVFKEIPQTKVVKAIHMGDYHYLPKTYEKVNEYMAENNLMAAGNPWEIYVTDPGQEPDTSKWKTEVYFPVE